VQRLSISLSNATPSIKIILAASACFLHNSAQKLAQNSRNMNKIYVEGVNIFEDDKGKYWAKRDHIEVA